MKTIPDIQHAESIGQAAQADATFLIVRSFPELGLEKDWREYLTRVEVPSHYNAPEFFLAPYWTGKRPFAILALDKGRIVGILTGVHEGDEVVSGLSTRPQICFDKDADVLAAGDVLTRGLLAEAGAAKLVTLYSWSWAPIEASERHGFRLRKLEGDVVLDLTQGSQALFKQFKEHRRRDIRLAMRHGVEVFQATTERDLLEYYDVYCGWLRTSRKKIAGPRVSFEAFKGSEPMTGNHRIFLARFSGKVIAASHIRLFSGGLIEYAGNSSLEEFLHLAPNDVLLWKIIEWGCTEGFLRFSLGGAHPFLRKWGGIVAPIYRYRLDRTWLRRHDLWEFMLERGRETLRKIPSPSENAIRRLLKKAPRKRK